MILGRNVDQGQTTCCVQECQLSVLLLVLSPFVMSDTDYPLISCPDPLEHFYDT